MYKKAESDYRLAKETSNFKHLFCYLHTVDYDNNSVRIVIDLGKSHFFIRSEMLI